MVRKPLLLTGVAAAAAVLLAATCGSQAETAGSCRPTVDWQGQRYYASSGGSGFPATAAPVVPKATVPRCVGQGAPKPIIARRLVGVSPILALRVDGKVYMPSGFFTALPDHPLHDAFWHSAHRPSLTRRGRRCQTVGRINDINPRYLTIKPRSGSPISVSIDVRTEIAGPKRAGQPYLESGNAVNISGRHCRLDDPSPTMTADTINNSAAG